MTKNKSRTGGDPAAVRRRVTSWLMADGYKIQEVSSPDAVWAFLAEVGQGPDTRRIIVAQHAIRKHSLLVQLQASQPPEVTSKIEALDPEVRHQLFSELRLRLLTLRVDFQNLQPPLNELMLRKILYVEDLTRTSFMSAVRLVQHAMLAMIWTVGERIGLDLADSDIVGGIN